MLNGHVSRSGPLTAVQQNEIQTALNQEGHLTSSVSPVIDVYTAHLEDDEALLPPEDTLLEKALPAHPGDGEALAHTRLNTTQLTPPSRLKQPFVRHRRILRIMSVILIVMLLLVIVRLSMIVSANNDQLQVHIGNQETAIVDLRQGQPISPYLLGANVFPAIGTSSLDQKYNGFMDYGPSISNGLGDARIKLLRFPGGNWGEEHIFSFDQLNAFSALLSEVGADGMIQMPLTSPMGGNVTLVDRARQAGHWVDYLNNPRSRLRTGKYAHAPYHPIRFWTVGNEPDTQINPDTGKPFTVAEYVDAFVQFSLAMHQNDPTIMVFGPDISQFYGVGVGPSDPDGQLWMEGFLRGVAAYEKAHPELKFHLLDGVSFHLYPLTNASKAPSLLLSSTDEWDYLLPPLRQLIREYLGRDVPLAVTEINSNSTGNAPSPGLAALWWADTLGSLMNQEVEYVAFFSAEGVDTPYPLFNTSGVQPTAMFRVMQVFSHLQHNLIPVEVQRAPVSVYATRDDSSQTLSLLFVNKSPLTQFAQVSALNQFFGFSPWHSLDISLFAFNITLLTLHRDGGAEAYNYGVPTSNDASITPLHFTVCGNLSDPLANDRPC